MKFGTYTSATGRHGRPVTEGKIDFVSTHVIGLRRAQTLDRDFLDFSTATRVAVLRHVRGNLPR